MLIRRDKHGRSPWIAAGTIVGAILGYGMTPIRLKAGDDLIHAVCALVGALLGLGVGIVLDIRKNYRQKSVDDSPSPASDEAQR